uniref:uncharacterized protein LOC104265647 isoform X1 n=1 Tax=Ciona intestinalis TaxID=7719 RepID=UPI00089DB843|nr:uncharacterized protein LOC104265647 isoform X1 [Ciona intestinalis]|eukprot:XP_009858431.2 uncharacterized protein LOC104265647 isoform X1 [Ciona intestinalis]
MEEKPSKGSASFGETVFAGLERASQQHESDLVIDLGVDRLLHWIGVYATIGLALVAKVSMYIDPNLSCFPTEKISIEYTVPFIAFADTYCWGSPKAEKNHMCHLPKNSTSLMKNPEVFISFIQWFPYMTLFQGLMLATPNAVWHFLVGGRLYGHLKFVKLLIKTMFDKFEKLKGVYYRQTAYDTDGESFDDLKKYSSKDKVNKERSHDENKPMHKVNLVKSNSVVETSFINPEVPLSPTLQTDEIETLINETGPGAEESGKSASESVRCCNVFTRLMRPCQVCCRKRPYKITDDHIALVKVKTPEAQKAECSKKLSKNKEDTNKRNCSEKLWDRVLGKMRDRHLFSMICFENFASMQHLPYILSVFKLIPPVNDSRKKKRGETPGRFPLHEGMLYLWCHKDNFQTTFLVKRYTVKHLCTALFACIWLVIMIYLGIVSWDSPRDTETFPCTLPGNTICILCTLKGKSDVLALLICDCVILTAVSLVSLFYWIFWRIGSERANCKFFEKLNSDSTTAFQQTETAENFERDHKAVHDGRAQFNEEMTNFMKNMEKLAMNLLNGRKVTAKDSS